MMNATQREIASLLTELCERSPDVRMGQLWAHLGFLGEDQTGRSLWEIEDDELLAVLRHHREELIGRQTGCAGVTPSVPVNVLPSATTPANTEG